MRSFKFRLEAVLSLRAAEKDAAYGVYAKAMRVRQEMELNINVAFQGYGLLARRLAESRAGQINPVDQKQALDAMDAQKQYIESAQRELTELETREKECLERYLKVKQRYEMLEKLKDKQFSDYALLAQKNEERLLDDVVNARTCRKQRNVC